MTRACALTGHRNLGEDFNCAALEREILYLIESGVKVFYCGMAHGFDLAAAECVLSHSEQGAELVACVPCPEQGRKYCAVDKLRYERILNNCKEKIIISPRYERGCMLKRDRFMVESCEVVLAYLRTKRGGTYYTVEYALAQGKKVIYI